MSTLVYDAHPAMARSNPLLFLLALLLVPVGVGLVILFVWYLKSISVRLRITDEEVQYEAGLLSKERRELKRASIRTVRIDQTFFNRLFGVADLAIYSAGDTPEITVRGLPQPDRLRQLL